MLEEKNTPLQTLKRLPFYLHYLEELEASGIEYISTPKIAMDLGFNEMSVKKDFACVTTEKGKPKVGHKVINLLNDLKSFLGCNLKKSACLVGVGNLGRALMGFKGFKRYGLEITMAFDVNPEVVGKTIQGIKVYNYVGDEKLSLISDNTYDIVINRHESYNEQEIYRILKPNGIFITQQVGAFNNKELSRFFDENHVDQFPELTLERSIKRLKNNDFNILFSDEYFPILKFYDLGAIAYFAKIIKWEFINFNVKDNIDKFLILQEELKKVGYIPSKEHRFIIVAKK